MYDQILYVYNTTAEVQPKDSLCKSEFCSALATFEVPSTGNVLEAFLKHCGIARYSSLRVGKRTSIEARKWCPSCRLIAATLAAKPAIAEVVGLEDVSIHFVQDARELPVSTLQICTEGQVGRTWQRGEFLLFCPPKYTAGGLGRLIRDVPVDSSKIQRWLSLCDSLHDERCKPPLGGEMESTSEMLRLIDVDEMRIAARPWNTTYFALSYVWGGVEQLCLTRSNRETLERPNSLVNLRSQSSRTVRDAMRFVRMIGGRYLWVDCLCLTNDDPIEMEKGIQSMYAIYNAAYATIVAANAASADAMLPRLSGRTPPPVQPSETIKPGLTMTAVAFLDESISKSVWRTRGWTLQEEVLSRRSIVFTNDRIYFRCGQRTWSEDTCFDDNPSKPGQEDSLQGKKLTFVGNRQGDPDNESWEICDILGRFQDIIHEYSVRSLTEKEDTVNAIVGALMPLAKQLGGGLLQGLPIGAWDLVILFENDPSSFGGTWQSWERKADFPSWSWAGWEDQPNWERTFPDWPTTRHFPTRPVDFHCAETALGTLTWIVWYRHQHGRAIMLSEASESPVRAADIRIQDIHALKLKAKELFPGLKTSRTKPSNIYIIKHYPILTFFTVSISLDLKPLPQSDADERNARHTHSTSYGQALHNRHGHECGNLRPDVAQYSEFSGPVELILLSEVSDYAYSIHTNPFLREAGVEDEKGARGSASTDNNASTFAGQPWRPCESRPGYEICETFWVMLVEWNPEGFYERRGLGAVVKAAVENCLRPGPVWKEILLG